MLRILWKKNWKYDVAAREISEHHEWKQAAYPLQYAPIKETLELGFIYGHKRDKYNHPVIVVDCGKIL